MTEARRGRGKHGEASGPQRRSFMRRAWQFLGLVVLAEAAWLVVSFLQPRRESIGTGKRAATFVAGRVDAFAPGSVTAFPRERFYLARLDDGGFLALSRVCTHLGCTVPWVAEERRFVCPCHASAFDIRGDVVSAPAPRALDTYELHIDGDDVTVALGEARRRKRFETKQAVYQE